MQKGVFLLFFKDARTVLQALARAVSKVLSDTGIAWAAIEGLVLVACLWRGAHAPLTLFPTKTIEGVDMNVCKIALVSMCLALSAGASFAQDGMKKDGMAADGMKKDGMAADGMKKMTMQECKDHMAMMKKDGAKKDDAMMMKKDTMCADMMKKDGAMKEPMKK